MSCSAQRGCVLTLYVVSAFADTVVYYVCNLSCVEWAARVRHGLGVLWAIGGIVSEQGGRGQLAFR